MVNKSDYLLSLINRGQYRAKEGILKIYLGMIAGVGKTYAMLQSAHALKKSGVDVVIGVIEHHGRKDTKALIEGIEQIPLKILEHKTTKINEFDIDAVIRRKPDVVLIDELAHTNAAGCRHAKRYLDVFEILKNGIDVHTTLNVQHIESRVDIVADITSVFIRETVPDAVIDRADEIVLIDLPPEELLQRLHDGKIYAAEQAQIASEKFFKKGTITALREIALRIASERADRDVRDYKTLHGIDDVWRSSGRLMVAIFASPYSEVLIRWARRVADLLGVTWVGAYVESRDFRSESDQKLLLNNMELVKKLGGELVQTVDSDVVSGLLRLAKENNITQIIVGKSHRTFYELFYNRGSIVNRLIRESNGVDIYVVSSNRLKRANAKYESMFEWNELLKADQLGLALSVCLVVWGICSGLESFLGYRSVGILFLMAVCFAGIMFTRAITLCMAVAFYVIYHYFFIPPKFTWQISQVDDVILIITFFIAATIIGGLTNKLSRKEKNLKLREEKTRQLYEMMKVIAYAKTRDEMVGQITSALEKSLDADILVYLNSTTTPDKLEKNRSRVDHDANDDAVAHWVYKNRKRAGRNTETLSASAFTFYPIVGSSSTLGVLGIRFKIEADFFNFEKMTLIESILNNLAAGIEREQMREDLRHMSVYAETQKLYKVLFDCVSHELKTPLAAIIGSATGLQDNQAIQNRAYFGSMLNGIIDGAERLQMVVDNLLDMTRIESDMVKPRLQAVDLTDVVAVALRENEREIQARPIVLDLSKALIPINCDPVLTKHVLNNILRNSLKYTPVDSAIEISAHTSSKNICLQIRDHGKGLPVDNPEKVFEKFYRGDEKTSGGLGIGLSIVRGFMQAQGGDVSAHNHPNGGAVFNLYFRKADIDE